MAVYIDHLNNPESSSDEDLSDSKISDPSEDESSVITSARETDTNHGGEEDEFWVRYPELKSTIDTIVAQGVIPKDKGYERAKLLGDEVAKELNEEGKALCLMEIELCIKKVELISSVISKMMSRK